MFILVRATVYATFFIAVLLVLLPARLVGDADVARARSFGFEQVVAGTLVLLGSALVVGCITAFVFIGRGTPAPFDPPRRLVIRGPYRWIRNPMYVGAGAALFGAALYYRSLPLAAYGLAFMVALHLFVVIYEEPALRRTFGREYQVYCERTGRWWPRSR